MLENTIKEHSFSSLKHPNITACTNISCHLDIKLNNLATEARTGTDMAELWKQLKSVEVRTEEIQE